MVIYYKQGQSAPPEKSTRRRVADAVFDFADQYQGTRQKMEASDAALQRNQAQIEAMQAAQAMDLEEQNFRRNERSRVQGEREADAELRRLLLDEARGSTTPTAARSPQMGALGMLGNVLGKAFGGQGSNDPDAEMAQAEHRKWDRYEQLAPKLSPEGATLLFSQLNADTQEKARKAQYGALSRRFGQLQMPAQSPGGAELPGLDPEDPEQGKVLAQIQGMIDGGEDPEKINAALANLEGEILRDRKHQVARERTAGRMMQALSQPPEFVSQEEIDQADEIALSFQADQGRDPKDAWEEFRDALFAGKDRWRAATEKASQFTMRDPKGPRLPTQDEVMAAGQILYPHDPKFQNQPPPLSTREQGRMPEFQDQQAFADGPIGYSSKYQEPAAPPGQFVQNGQLVTSQPPKQLAPEVKQEVQAKLTPDVMQGMMDAVSAAGSVEDANAALVAASEKAGVDPKTLPEWLLKTLGMHVGQKEATDSKKPKEPEGVEFQEQEAFKEGPIAYSTKYEEKPTPKTWKRLSADEQKNARTSLGEAIKNATRHDFFGALAPTLRKLGIDLGSLPKKEAQALREQLKKARSLKGGFK